MTTEAPPETHHPIGQPAEDMEQLIRRDQEPDRTTENKLSEHSNLHPILTPYENWEDYFNALPSFIRGYVGSGLTVLPFTFYTVGFAWGVALTIICCISNYYLMKLIALTCDDCHVSKNGWGNMCGVVGGWKLQLVAEISLMFSQLGTCIGESMFALKFLNYAFCGLDIDSICNHTFEQVLMILIVIIPLTAVTNMRYLSVPNDLADFATLGFISVTIYLGVHQLGSFSVFWDHFKENFFSFKPSGTILFFGTLVYAIGGVGAILDVRNSMRNKQQFYPVLRSGFIIVGCTFGLFGVFNGLISLGATQDIYLYNLPITKLSLTSQIVFLFTITMTYITNQFPIITILESWIDPKDKHFHADNTHGGIRMIILRYLVRYLLVTCVISVAYFLPSFNLFLSFVGSYNFAVMNGLLPVITYNMHFKGRMSLFTKYLNITLLILCLIFGGIGMVQSVIGMFE